MSYSRIVRDGLARDEALKRRNSVLRETLGMAPKPKPDPEQPARRDADEKPGEPPFSSPA